MGIFKILLGWLFMFSLVCAYWTFSNVYKTEKRIENYLSVIDKQNENVRPRSVSFPIEFLEVGKNDYLKWLKEDNTFKESDEVLDSLLKILRIDSLDSRKKTILLLDSSIEATKMDVIASFYENLFQETSLYSSEKRDLKIVKFEPINENKSIKKDERENGEFDIFEQALLINYLRNSKEGSLLREKNDRAIFVLKNQEIDNDGFQVILVNLQSLSGLISEDIQLEILGNEKLYYKLLNQFRIYESNFENLAGLLSLNGSILSIRELADLKKIELPN